MAVALVTGATGFCGRHLVERLRQDSNFEILGTGRSQTPPTWLTADEYKTVDLLHPKAAENLLADTRPDLILHLAGVADGADSEIYALNYAATLKVLESARLLRKSPRILLVGSAAEYGEVGPEELPISEEQPCRPLGVYGLSKLAATLAGLHYHARFGLKIVVVRPFNLIGPAIPPTLLMGAILQRAKQALLSGGPPIVKAGNLDAERDFISVTDAVDIYVKLLMGEHWGQVFNVCGGFPVAVHSLVSSLLSHSPSSLQLEIDPAMGRASSIQVSYGSPKKREEAIGKQKLTPRREPSFGMGSSHGSRYQSSLKTE